MSLVEGQQVELAIEKPASGGRMIARHLGQIVLVRGAIPGERVVAWIERAEKRMAYAVTREVLESSPDRRPGWDDPLCGGALYSHIAYERQLAIKSDVIRDAFSRLGRYPIEGAIDVVGSREDGYRMRARLHVHAGRAGFYREGTHQLCDAGPTQQLGADAVTAVSQLASALEREAHSAVASISIAENMAADQRAAHVELVPGARLSDEALERAAADARLSGVSARDVAAGRFQSVGHPVVVDPLPALTGGRVASGTLQRRAESFFQGNRYLLPALVDAVAAAVPDAGEVLDLYAGVGVFAVALAALGHLEVTAVEGDRAGGADLRENARAQEPRLKVHVASVEAYLASRRDRRLATAIVDPPRTGLSKEAADAIVRQAPARLVYVSCDPPTLARDARRLLDAGYRLETLRAFDLFPNTPHVEALAVFTKRD
ncbi:MAG TPA: TRAM domain-containing protein [Vicinamibacterales bacterium]|nr:TRAM domain-containing protein [Vicinamibacterales bacterium]